MRLKSLEMHGFKSFTDRTLFNFTPDISAIVGPNGCGKSNVVDALRWVMGEQSVRHLRGQHMEDVIFNGSESVPPTGMAEVSLTFENSDGRGPVEYNGFTEIVVTRRLFRSGDSEYSINKTSCRLKDIIDLFLGTGVGSKAYSIVEQGRVDEMVNAKPEDRRAIIEEAAGTSKYRSRKLAAERKLERARQNLLRVSDIVREVERQIRSIELQAKKAERFKAMREELKGKEVSSAALQRKKLEEEISAFEEELAQVEDRFAQAVASLHAKEAEIEKSKHELLEADRGISSLQESLYQRKVEIHGEEQKLNFYRKDRAELDDAKEKTQAGILEMQANLRSVALEIDSFKKAGEDCIQLSLFEGGYLKQKEVEMEDVRLQIQKFQSEVEQGKEKLLSILNRISQMKNDRVAREKQRVEIGDGLSRNQREQVEVTNSLEGWRKTQQEKRAALALSLSRAKEVEVKIGVCAEDLQQWTPLREERDRKLDALKGQLQEVCSSFSSLEALQKNYEGYHEGVRAIMLKRQREAVFDGVYGLVADVIEAPANLEKALTAVLGDRLQYIIVRGHEDGIEAIAYLKQQSAGRGSFIPCQLSTNGHHAAPLANSGTLTPFLDIVSVKEGYRGIAEYLLGDVAVVPDLMSGFELWSRNGISKTLVTIEGEVIDPKGVVTGGSTNGLEESLLSQKRRIKELEVRSSDLEEQVQQEEKELEDLRGRIERDEERRAHLTEEGHRLEVERVQLEHALLQAEQESARFHEALQVCAREHQELTTYLESLEEAILECDSTIEAGLREEEGRHKELEEKQQALSRLGEDLASLETQVTESRIRTAKLSEKKENTRLNLENRERFQEDLSNRIRVYGDQIAELGQKQVWIIEATHRAEEWLAENGKSVDTLEENIEAERGRYRDLSRSLTEKEEAVKELRSSVDYSQEEKGRLQLSLSEHRLTLQHLFDGIKEKYAVDLEAVPLDGLEEGTQGENLPDEIEELKGRIDRLGEVNLTAISEFEDLNVRYEFLSKQKEDLESSMADLQKTIAKLNRFCRVRFKESFEEINRKFQEIFTQLFGGGKARLVLTDESDYLETGVDIIAQPPGKKLQAITLLSGGEKALTAVSFLFAIFSTKPSPFCFLDEVDAPLDDANIERFLGLVQDMCCLSQFVLITHNKRTMQAAEVLYGVAMSNPGISKVVSVKMN